MPVYRDPPSFVCCARKRQSGRGPLQRGVTSARSGRARSRPLCAAVAESHVTRKVGVTRRSERACWRCSLCAAVAGSRVTRKFGGARSSEWACWRCPLCAAVAGCRMTRKVGGVRRSERACRLFPYMQLWWGRASISQAGTYSKVSRYCASEASWRFNKPSRYIFRSIPILCLQSLLEPQ